MTRIDFRHGVTFLSFFLLVISIVHILGYLDEQTYISVPLDNSFYEPSTELILVYTNYDTLLYVFFISLFFLFVLMCKPLDEQVIIYQLKCYCPYFPYQQVVCLIPFILRYANTNDDIPNMYQVYWNRFFPVISAILQFIQSYWWSVVENYMLKYRLKRLIFNISKPVIYLFTFYFIFILCCNCVELLKREEVSKEFLIVRSFFDNGSLLADLNVNMETYHEKSFSLDQNLFRHTGQKLYQTSNSESFRAKDKNGISLPYQRRTYYAGIGESVSLSCHAFSDVVGPVSVLWFLNGKYLRSNDSTCNITTNVKKAVLMQEISSQLDIDIIENNGFGNYTCSFRNYDFTGKKVSFKHEKAFPSIKSIQKNIAQYSVKKHSGDDIFIYTTPGGVIDIRWKPMVFNNDLEDVIEFYYVNGVQYNRPNQIGLSCSALSFLFTLCGQASNWFVVPCTSNFFQFFENLNLFETRFTACAVPNVFGVHTVKYFRRVYNEKQKKSFVLQEVKHPDTIYVQLDLPYFLKMDNATMEKENKIIRNLHKSGLEYLLNKKTITCLWTLRIGAEMLFVCILFILFLCFLYVIWISIDYLIQKIRKKMILEQLIDNANRRPPYYLCYILCGDTDTNLVENDLVEPLRKKNIKTGFNYDECSINKSGRSIFDILPNILKECEHLGFFLTSSYIKEKKFVDIDLETVLACIKCGFVSADKVLIINADGCELQDKLRLNLPNAAANVLDWVRVTKPDERIDLILKWIKRKKKDSETSDTCFEVSTAFLG